MDTDPAMLAEVPEVRILTLAESSVLAMASRSVFSPWPYDHYDVLREPVWGVIVYLYAWVERERIDPVLSQDPRLVVLWRLEDWLQRAESGHRHNLRVRNSPFFGRL
jgi:hypothetical protein